MRAINGDNEIASYSDYCYSLASAIVVRNFWAEMEGCTYSSLYNRCYGASEYFERRNVCTRKFSCALIFYRYFTVCGMIGSACFITFCELPETPDSKYLLIIDFAPSVYFMRWPASSNKENAYVSIGISVFLPSRHSHSRSRSPFTSR